MKPTPPANLVALWQLSAPEPLAETPRAFLWRVDLPDGGKAVLKCSRQDAGMEEANAGVILRYWRGDGAVAVFGESGPHLLLEYLPGPSAGDLARDGDDVAAFDAVLAVATRLHLAKGNPPSGPVSLAQWCRGLTARPALPGVSTNMLDRAARLAERLLQTAPAPRLLHGDLHHDNVLSGPRGWSAIDPKGLWGDPAFDLANAFRNPEGFGPRLHDPARARRMATKAESVLGYDRARLLAWAAVQCGLSICWDAEQNAPQADDIALLPMLLALADD